MQEAGIGDHNPEGQTHGEEHLAEAPSPGLRIRQPAPIWFQIILQALHSPVEREAPDGQNQQHQPGQGYCPQNHLADRFDASENAEIHGQPGDQQSPHNMPLHIP